MTTSTKTAAHAAVKTLSDEAASLATRRAELAAQHAAEQESIRTRQNEISAIQAPLNELLQARTALIERIECATTQLARQGELQKEWVRLVDLAVGVKDAMHLLNFANLWKAYPGEANATRVATEIEGFISRRQSELENLEAEIQSYAAAQELGYLLPVSMGGKAQE